MASGDLRFRLEEPTCNSHAREGVERTLREFPASTAGCGISHGGPSDLNQIHSITTPPLRVGLLNDGPSDLTSTATSELAVTVKLGKKPVLI